MSAILTEDWVAGNFSQWIDANALVPGAAVTNPNYRIKSIDGQNAFTCSFTNGGVIGAYAGVEIASQAAALQSVGIRLRTCVFVTEPSFTDIGIAQVDEFYSWGNSSSVNFWGLLLVKSDGAIAFRYGTTTIVALSSTGVIPLDGTEVAIQLGINFPSHDTVEITITVNNSLVASGSLTTTATPCIFPDLFSWGYYELGHFSDCAFYHERAGISHVVVIASRFPASCTATATILVSNTFAEIDNSHAVIDFMPTGRTIVGVDCWHPAVADGLSYNCDTELLTITGTGFVDGAFVDVRGPEGDSVVFTQASLTETEITGTLASFTPGRYCVTVSNPCS